MSRKPSPSRLRAAACARLPRASPLALVLALASIRRGALRPAPGRGPGKTCSVTVDRNGAKAAADAWLKAAGDDPAGYLSVATTATALPALEDRSETGTGLVPYGESDARGAMAPRAGRHAASHDAGRQRSFRGRSGTCGTCAPSTSTARPSPVDARTGRIAGFRRTFPEAEAGASPDEAASRARRRRRVLASFGFDPLAWDVVSSKSEARKARRDTLVVFESRLEHAGEAARRAVTGFAGDVPSLFATALKLPEDWVRAREKSTAATYVAIVWKILAWGTLVGLLVVEFVRLARAGAIPWRRARFGSRRSSRCRRSSRASSPSRSSSRATTRSSRWPVFAVVAGVGLLVGVLVSFGVALLAVALVLAVKSRRGGGVPARRRRRSAGPRRGGRRGRCSSSASAHSRTGLEAAFPLEAGVPGFPFPAGSRDDPARRYRDRAHRPSRACSFSGAAPPFSPSFSATS